MMERACLIGAGASGLAAAKIFHERGIPFDCFEMSSGVGGLWRYENDNGQSAAYASLQTNTSRGTTGYSDFPLPEHYPDFPTHRQMLAYLESYVERFGFGDAIRFRIRVERVDPLPDGSYEVTIRALDEDVVETVRYGAVVVANGHLWKPNYPDLPGSFDGVELHSRDYRTPEVAEGRRVLIVGVGNSACDIVAEVSPTASTTFLSTRRGAHVVPKYLLGRPVDTWLSPLSFRMPLPLRRSLFRLLIFLTQGRQSTYGFPTPDTPLGSTHPTVSSHLLPLVKSGEIIPKPDVTELEGERVVFADGSEEEVDVLIYATGYEVAFPFLDFIEVADNYLPLYRHVVHPDHPNLYFLGFVQPLGALPPVAEAQAEWIADLLEGRAGLPDAASMWSVIHEEDARRESRYVHSKRHRMEVDGLPYIWELERERKTGRTRRPAKALETSLSPFAAS